MFTAVQQQSKLQWIRMGFALLFVSSDSVRYTNNTGVFGFGSGFGEKGFRYTE